MHDVYQEELDKYSPSCETWRCDCPGHDRAEGRDSRGKYPHRRYSYALDFVIRDDIRGRRRVGRPDLGVWEFEQ